MTNQTKTIAINAQHANWHTPRTYWKVHLEGHGYCLHETQTDADADAESLRSEGGDVTIETVTMTPAQMDAVPEFTGW